MYRYRVRVAMIARTHHKLCLSRRPSFNALYAAEQGDAFLRPLQFSAPRYLEIAQRAAA